MGAQIKIPGMSGFPAGEKAGDELAFGDAAAAGAMGKPSVLAGGVCRLASCNGTGSATHTFLAVTAHYIRC